MSLRMDNPKKSFAEIVGSKNVESSEAFDRQFLFPKKFHESFQKDDNSNNFLKKAGVKDGKPAIFLSDSEVDLLAGNFNLALIGKFPINRPKLDYIRVHFNNLKLSGKWNVGLLDDKHILIQLTSDDDYASLFTKGSLMIGGSFCKILKWTKDFDYNLEPSFAPIWVRFPGLKLHLFNKQILYSLAATLGRPLKLDSPTFNITRPSIVRILVEIDVSKPIDDAIWIGSETVGYWQKIEAEFVPFYCNHCRMFGHTSGNCFHLHPHLKEKKNLNNLKDRDQNRAVGCELEKSLNSILPEEGHNVDVVIDLDTEKVGHDSTLVDMEIHNLVENSLREAAEIIFEETAEKVLKEFDIPDLGDAIKGDLEQAKGEVFELRRSKSDTFIQRNKKLVAERETQNKTCLDYPKAVCSLSFSRYMWMICCSLEIV